MAVTAGHVLVTVMRKLGERHPFRVELNWPDPPGYRLVIRAGDFVTLGAGLFFEQVGGGGFYTGLDVAMCLCTEGLTASGRLIQYQLGD